MSQNFGTGNSALVVIAATMAVIIGSVVLLATYLPTKQALQLEPSQALHYQ
jgi:ABC-type lipoprotein release transport system permease subunit